jgi:hypothetical protein
MYVAIGLTHSRIIILAEVTLHLKQEKKKQAEIRHHERQLRQHAAKELMEFEATIKSELDTQIEALVLEKVRAWVLRVTIAE